MRDAVAYLLATLSLLCIMLRGVLSAWEAVLLLLGYVAYLTTCLLTSRGGAAGGHHHTYFAVSPSQEQLQMAAAAAEEQLQLVVAGDAAALNGSSSAHGEEHAGGSRHASLDGVVVSGGANSAGPARGQHIELVSRAAALQRKGSGRMATPDSSRPTSPLRGKPGFTSAADMGSSSAALAGPGGAELELTGLVAGVPPSDGGVGGADDGPSRVSPRGAAWRAKLSSSNSSRMGKVLHSASLGVEELLHSKGKQGPRLWLTLLMAPAMLLLHATMPALHPGEEGWLPWGLGGSGPACALCCLAR